MLVIMLAVSYNIVITYKKEREMKLELTQKETQAVISASDGMLEDLKNLKAKNQISVGWSIMFDDLVSGLKKAKDQYYKQLKNKERENGTSN